MMLVLETHEERDRMTTYVLTAAKRMYNIALGYLENEMDAQDAVQQSLENFMKQFQRNEVKTNYRKEQVTAFLCVIVRNACIDMLRKRGRQGAVYLPNEEDEEVSLNLMQAMSVPSFEDGLLDQMAFQAIIKRFSGPDQALLYAFHVLGRKRSEAAALAGYTENGAKSRLKKLYAALRHAKETEVPQ